VLPSGWEGNYVKSESFMQVGSRTCSKIRFIDSFASLIAPLQNVTVKMLNGKFFIHKKSMSNSPYFTRFSVTELLF